MRIRESAQLKTVLGLYDQDSEHKVEPPTEPHTFENVVKKLLEQRNQNLEARVDRAATGVPAKANGGEKVKGVFENKEIAPDG